MKPLNYRKEAIANATPPKPKGEQLDLDGMWELRVPLENGGKQVLYAETKEGLDVKLAEFEARDPNDRPAAVGNWATLQPGVLGGGGSE